MMSEQEHSLCHELLKSLSDYMDGELSAELCAEIERHMHGCDRCRIVVDTLRKTVELYQDNCGEEPLPKDVHDRLLARLNLEDYSK